MLAGLKFEQMGLSRLIAAMRLARLNLRASVGAVILTLQGKQF